MHCSSISMQKIKDNFVTALSRGISILEAFDEANPELGITQIARKVGLSKTTTFRLVQTLVVLRYLVLSSENKYRLGPRVLSLGFNVLQTLDLKTIAAPHLQSLSKECHETVNMAVLDEYELVYIERIKTQQISEWPRIQTPCPIWIKMVKNSGRYSRPYG